MGRNRAIKAFDPKRAGQPLDLFASGGRLPVIIELLQSPWIVRASEIGGDSSGVGGKRRERAIDVAWDGGRAAPVAFTLDGRRYRIDAIVQSWTIERAWWDPRRRSSRRCFRVLARGGIYDLAYDRLAGVWLLDGVVD